MDKPLKTTQSINYGYLFPPLFHFTLYFSLRRRRLYSLLFSVFVFVPLYIPWLRLCACQRAHVFVCKYANKLSANVLHASKSAAFVCTTMFGHSFWTCMRSGEMRLKILSTTILNVFLFCVSTEQPSNRQMLKHGLCTVDAHHQHRVLHFHGVMFDSFQIFNASFPGSVVVYVRVASVLARSTIE